MNGDAQAAPFSYTETAHSRLDEAERLSLKIRVLLQQNGLSPVCFASELLAREALNNAVIHGNGSDADKSITLRLRVGHVWIRMQVTDEGPGFDWRGAQKQQSGVTATSGRGVQLYGMYARRVRFNRRGNQITLWIRRNSATGEDKREHGCICD